jgi:hypothetical protein
MQSGVGRNRIKIVGELRDELVTDHLVAYSIDNVHAADMSIGPAA